MSCSRLPSEDRVAVHRDHPPGAVLVAPVACRAIAERCRKPLAARVVGRRTDHVDRSAALQREALPGHPAGAVVAEARERSVGPVLAQDAAIDGGRC